MNRLLLLLVLGLFFCTSEVHSQVVVVRRPVKPVYYRPWVRPVPRRLPPPVVVPAVVVRVLPPHRVIYYAGIPYYYASGVYYVQVQNTETYKVVEAPSGMMRDTLPENAKQTVIDDEVYYVAAGVYYKVVKIDGVKKYTVVKL
ncbi:hypothetical protein NBRC110019_06440 [Neptunitalea chrysea]|uniref:Uncharacterized protein n=1 Tax=Neptunitalea chrysea TaxID=1647581 RepID=A0A9W6ETB4_9FLAO|nr:DUF6515 family protein [Neptunitalea chrysea]GLB51605.1 hypothetical protein NBRC110019_06440 [Neptunitalea chrysea]